MKETRYKSAYPLLILMVLALISGMPAGYTQTAPPPPGAAVYAPQQLDQLLAPVALYPDPLLAQILMAATYPLEVIEAYRWVGDPAHAQLHGDALAAALQDQDWDPSVKALVPFPQILGMMNDHLGWMQQLGDAFLAQQAEVTDAVQRLRARANAAGTLQSTDRQIVTTQDDAIAIEPVSPETVYVPVYGPTVYGPWPYPGYPPYDFVPLGYTLEPGAVVWIPIGIVTVLWGWDDWDWRHRRIHIDPDRFNHLRGHKDEDEHRHRPEATFDTWEHDPHHRRGVPYRNPDLLNRFRPNPAGSPEPRRDFRGFKGPPRPVHPHHESAGPHPPAAAPIQQNRAPAPGRPPAVFEDYDSGHKARTESKRGHASRETTRPFRERQSDQPTPPQRGGSLFRGRAP